MRLLFVLLAIVVLSFSSFAQPVNSKAKLVTAINAISEKPSVFVSYKHLYIIHPMIKKEDREREYKIKANLKCDDDSCKITYTSYEQTKGPKSKSTIELGKTFRFNYPINTLKTFLAENEFNGWNFSDDLELDEQQFSGYKSAVIVAGVEKDFVVYIKDEQLYAVSCGFAKSGISHADEVEESADFWYFEQAGGKLRLAKKFTIEATKSNSVPILTKTTDNYQY